MIRDGFTLLEVMVAIVLTSIISLLVYGSARTGIDTGERLERFRAATSAQITVRNVLTDALRHPPEEGGIAMNDLLFVLEDRTQPDGTPADAIAFSSKGRTYTLEATGQGVVLATPERNIVLPAVRGLDVRVMNHADDAAWLERWESPGRVPAAVAIQFVGADALAPVVVRAALETQR